MDSSKLALVFGVLFALSEAIGMIPSIQANSVFQMIFSILKKLAGK
jgi:hypothetical protein